MKALPGEISQKLQPNLKVVWWGRRAVYEIVEEFSEAAFRVWIALSAALWLFESRTRLGLDPVGFWVAIFIACLLLSNYAIYEFYRWRNEIYIVAMDDVNGGGRVYKFWGWVSKKHIDEPISPNSPTLIFDQGLYYRIWGYLTGEKMCKLSLKSMNHTYLDGERISPRFEKAIQDVRGGTPSKNETVSELHSLSDIKQALVDNLIDEKFAREATRAIINRKVFGE